jgi:site-specific recombinase XerD
MTDNEALNAWVMSKSEGTREQYRRISKQFFAFIEENTNVQSLRGVTAYILCQYKADIEKQNYRAATIRLKLSAIKSLFSFMVGVGHLPTNVGAMLKCPRANSCVDERIIPQSAVDRLTEAASEGRNRTLIQLLYGTGLRVTEACGVRAGDIKLPDSEQDKTAVIRVIGKGQKLRRVRVKREVAQGMLALASLNLPTGDRAPVFTGRDKTKRINRRTAHAIVKRAARDANINSKTSSHWLRHAHATHALAGGCPLEVLRKSLGHTSLDTTSLYLHVGDTEGSGNYIK